MLVQEKPTIGIFAALLLSMSLSCAMPSRGDSLKSQPLTPSATKTGLSAGIMAGQAAVGLLLGMGGGYLGVKAASDKESCGEGYCLELVGALIGGGIGYSLGTSLGIWGIGKAGGGRGSYFLTFLGTAIGMATGVFILESTLGSNDNLESAIVFLGISNLTALGAYLLSDKLVRTRISLEKSRGSGSKHPALKTGADIILARW